MVSHIATGLVQRRKVGSPTRKAVLMFMAACASDDGSGVWTSKANMADDLEMGRRTVQVCIDDLVAMGLISEAGRKACRNGFTVEYRLNLDAISALEGTREDTKEEAKSTRAGAAPVQDVHVTRAGAARQDVQELHINLPRTIHEPSKGAREVLCSILSEKVADDFIAHRKAMKKPLTERAAELIVSKLTGCGDPDEIVNASIMNGWQGVFPERQSKGGQPSAKSADDKRLSQWEYIAKHGTSAGWAA